MLRIYFISVSRSLWKNKLNSFIIIFSIATAIAASLLLFKYANYQLSFDKFNRKADRIYRVPYKKYEMGDILFNTSKNVSALAPWLKEKFPEIEESVRIFTSNVDNNFEYKDKNGDLKYIVDKQNWVDSNFLRIFPLEFIYGNKENAFKNYCAIYLSESLSRKMFGDENPLGKEINLHPANNQPYVVEGVYKDFPANSHINFNTLTSFKPMEGLAVGNSWLITGVHTYILLKENVSVNDFQRKIDDALNGELGRLITESVMPYVSGYKDYKELISKRKFKYEFKLQPLSQLNFSLLEDEIKNNKEMRTIIFMLVLSVLILLIAWINFSNLAGIKMIENMVNTQIRKVVGANKTQIFLIFVTESIIVNFVGFILALIIYRSIFPYFINLTGLPAVMPPFSFCFNGVSNFNVFVLIVSLLFFISLIIPLFIPFFKFYVSHTNETAIPYRNTQLNIKSIMVIIQFTFSIFMISSIVTISRQMSYMNQRELGFNPEQIYVIQTPYFIGEDFYYNYMPFIEEIKKNPLITGYTSASSVPPMNIDRFAMQRYQNSSKLFCNDIFYNEDYFSFFNIKIVAGNNFLRGSELNDSINRKIIINETACNQLGFMSPEEAIGKSIYTHSPVAAWSINPVRMQVIGVCSDYYHNSVKQQKKSIIFFQIPALKYSIYACFKFKAGSTNEALSFIRKKWKEFFPAYPLTGSFFLDEEFRKEYDSDIRFGIISGIFSFLSILLACTGLFMLSSFNILKRIKEIGIRKSNGATSFQIIILFVKKFLNLILIAYVIAAPVSYYIMNKWLMNYPYRIAIGLWFFLLPLAIIVLITMVTILYQVFTAARTNPVETLRYE